MIKESDRLYSLSKTHFIGENSVPLFVPGFDEPIDTFSLIRSENLVVLVDVGVILLILERILSIADVIEVEAILYLCYLGVGELRSFFGVIL